MKKQEKIKTTQEYLLDFITEFGLLAKEKEGIDVSLAEMFVLSNKYAKIIDTNSLEILKKQVGVG